MDWFWTWKGKCFGYRQGTVLRTFAGHDVGRFIGDEIFDQEGKYLGEVKNEKYLITCISKKSKRTGRHSPFAKNAAYAKYANYAGYAMYAGYEDFPDPNSFR